MGLTDSPGERLRWKELKEEFKNENLELPKTQKICLHKDYSVKGIALPNGGMHIKASCQSCGKFIKFLSQKEYKDYKKSLRASL